MPDPDQPHVKNGATTKLATIQASGMTEFGYVSDFGDNWEHRIVVEQTKGAETDAKYPGFSVVNVDAHLKIAAAHLATLISSKILPARTARRRKRRLIWYGGPYDPDDIDVEQINITLGRIANSYRPGRLKSVKK